jgi:hypothetical protein
MDGAENISHGDEMHVVPRQNSITLCFLRFLAHYELRFQTALNR